MAVVAAATSVALAVGVATLDRHRAANAADAAALAAALHAVAGPDDACGQARVLGRLDGATVTSCAVDGSIVEVTTAVGLPGVLARLGPAIGRARAGPVSLAP